MRLFLLGRSLDVCHLRVADTRYIWEDGDRLFVALPTSDVRQVRLAVDRWFMQRAREYLPARVRALSAQTGWDVHRIRLRLLRSRWGSCSIEGNVSLNIQLMHLEPDLIDYVLIHELAHTREMNHSKAFWYLVGQHCPTYRQCRARLVAWQQRLQSV